MASSDDKPVLNGLIALVAVAVAVGLIAGLSVLIGVKVLGIGGGGAAADSGDAADNNASLYLPDPVPTQKQSGPLITLAPEPGESSPTASPSAKAEEKGKKQKRRPITLSTSSRSVSSQSEFELSGSYRKGEGAILQVQRKVDGAWVDFPVTASVTDGTYSVPVQSSQTGANQFRMIDSDSGRASNVVKVNIT